MNRMIDAAVRCVKCNAKMGECDCWELGGWYDHVVGIQGREAPLAEFLHGLGITLKDCTMALSRKATP